MFHVEPGGRLSPIAANPPAAAEIIFGPRLRLAQRYCDALVGAGVDRGLIGPREAPRLWERHLLNCAVIGELIPPNAHVVDVGSGAGLPGIPLALARPDLEVTLLEPQQRRVQFLTEFIAETGVSLMVLRGRAEESSVRNEIGVVDIVTSRAVASLAVVAKWSLPLLRDHGRILAIKGASARDEVERDRNAVTRAGGANLTVVECGQDLMSPATIVITVERMARQRRMRPL